MPGRLKVRGRRTGKRMSRGGDGKGTETGVLEEGRRSIVGVLCWDWGRK